MQMFETLMVGLGLEALALNSIKDVDRYLAEGPDPDSWEADLSESDRSIGARLEFFKLLPATLKTLLLPPLTIPAVGFVLMSPDILLTHLSLCAITFFDECGTSARYFSDRRVAKNLTQLEWLSIFCVPVEPSLSQLTPRLKTLMVAESFVDEQVIREPGLEDLTITSISTEMFLGHIKCSRPTPGMRS